MSSRERLMDLLTDRALVGLGQREQIELAELLLQIQDVDVSAFDAAASSIALASIGNVQPLPARLADTLEASALAALGAFDAQGASGTRPASDYAKTREIQKLAPGFAQQTQIDVGPTPSIEPESDQDSNDFKRTLQLPFAATPPQPPQPQPRISPPQHVPPQHVPPQHVRASMPASQHYAPSSQQPSGPHSNVVPFSRPAPRGPSRVVAISGWIAAAACLALAIGAYVLRSPRDPIAIRVPPISTTSPTSTAPETPPPAASQTPAQLREALLAAQGSARAEWSPTKDPLGKTATGEVVWNKDQQKGTMRFRGLAKNDPKLGQYQLWIFDKTRDDKYPVDGGVFDVDSETGDVVVPIRATLPVSAPVLFAVTLEKPGGVVVSKRDRIVVTAKLPTG